MKIGNQILTTLKKFDLMTGVVVLLSLIVLVLTIRGDYREGKLWYQQPAFRDRAVGGPFESSNSASRFALVEALAERGSFVFNLDEARMAAPDMVQLDGKFFTIFTPGISFFAVPFYKIGQIFQIEQLASYFSTTIFAICSLLLISKLAQRLNVKKPIAIIGGFVFLFATNAFAYSQTLTQHHGSTTLILAALYITMLPVSWKRNIFFGIISGLGMLFDFPNMFMLFAIGLFLFSKHLDIKKRFDKYRVTFNYSIVLVAVGMIPFILGFLYYNTQTTGSPLQIGQMFYRSDYFDTDEVKAQHKIERQKSQDTYADKLPFSTKIQLNSGYVLLLSDERAWWYYSPIILLGIIGIILSYREKKYLNYTVLFSSIILLNILMYSMFGDPWGGWSFGPRYLIPGAAISSVLFAYALEKYKKNLIFLIISLGLFGYSAVVNTAGALTSLNVPPLVEAQQLEYRIPHTYLYNLEQLQEGKISSLLYKRFFSSLLSARWYWYALSSLVIVIPIALWGIEVAQSTDFIFQKKIKKLSRLKKRS